MNAGDGRKGRHLSGEDIQLWEHVVRSVRPMRKRSPRAERPVSPEPKPVAAHRPAVAPPPPAPAAKPAPPPPVAPLERRLKQKLARGSQALDGRLDLHGHTQAEAHDALYRFLRRTQSRGGRLVLVITGKGERSGERKPGGRGEGVLRRAVPLWLALPEFRALVIGFDAAAPAHGGEGALYVRLRKARD
jgi:DNA-nicking Smr family endonuclease